MKLAVDGRAFHDDPVAFRLLDIEFHQSLNDAARQPPAVARWRRGSTTSGSTCGAWRATMPGVIEKSVGQHIEVAEAVLAGDADAAAAAYRRHLEHVRDTTIAVDGQPRNQHVRMPMPEQIAFRMNLFPGQAAEYRRSATTRSFPNWPRR